MHSTHSAAHSLALRHFRVGLPAWVVLVLLSSLAEIGHAAERRFYVCDNHATQAQYNGDDRNDGLSPLTAWRSFAKALQQINHLKAGETLAFCRGGQFYHSTEYAKANPIISNTHARRDKPIVISSYVPDASDPSAQQMPIIWDHSVRFFKDKNPACDNKPENCSGKPRNSQGPFQLRDSFQRAVHNEGLILEQLILRSDHQRLRQIARQKGLKDWRKLIPSAAINIGMDYDDITIRQVEISGFRVGIRLLEKGPKNPTPESNADGNNERITIEQSFIHDNLEQGFIGVADDLTLSHNIFINNGAVPGLKNTVRYHNIYISRNVETAAIKLDQNSASQRVKIIANALHQSALFRPKTSSPLVCGGSSLSVHGSINELEIAHNLIWEEPGRASPGCWGIAISHGYSYKHFEAFYRANIHNNLVVNMGNVSIGCSMCDGATIADNTLWAGSDASKGYKAFAVKGIRIPVRPENNYDPCLEVDALQQVTPVALSWQNQRPTDPDGHLLNSINHPDEAPAFNVRRYQTANGKRRNSADGVWLTQKRELLLWEDARGKPIKKPMKKKNPRYASLNCNPKHVLLSDNVTRGARISANRVVIDINDAGHRVKSPSLAIEVGDDLRKGLKEIDLNRNGSSRDDAIDIYAVASNAAFYSTRTLSKDSSQCAAALHPSSADTDLIDQRGGKANQCTRFSPAKPGALIKHPEVQKIQRQIQSRIQAVPQTSAAFWQSTGLF